MEEAGAEGTEKTDLFFGEKQSSGEEVCSVAPLL